MKQVLPYNALLALAVAATGLIIGYQLLLRPSFPVSISYAYPGEAPETAGQESPVEFPLDLNRATQQELTQVPGIGEVISGRIIQRRDELGGFSSLEQLGSVQGIGEAGLAGMLPYLAVETLPDELLE